MIGRVASIVIAVGVTGSAAWGTTPDHLRCYKVRDSAAKASYSADIDGLTPGTSRCTIKVPGQLLCVETAKTNLDPPPLVDGNGPSAGRFLCYKAKCPKTATAPVTWTDQFGTRT